MNFGKLFLWLDLTRLWHHGIRTNESETYVQNKESWRHTWCTLSTWGIRGSSWRGSVKTRHKDGENANRKREKLFENRTGFGVINWVGLHKSTVTLGGVGVGVGGAVKTFKQLIKCLLRLPPPYFCSVSRPPGRESAHTVCNQPTGYHSAVSMLGGSSPRKIAQHQTKNYKNPVKKKKKKRIETC